MVSSVFAIGGPHGSGKSSVAKRLAKELQMNYVSAGEIFREIAIEKGYSLKEFSKIVINEPDIDRRIDERTKNLGKKDNTIVDAQLAAHFTPSDALLKICINASPDARYKRIAKRERQSFSEAKSETMVREQAEKQRFLTLYDINVDDLSKYDVIINTDRLSYDQVFTICKNLIIKALEWLE